MANLKDIGYGVGKYLEASDASGIPDIGTNRKNLDLLNFKVATNNAYALYNFKDGMIDAYQTQGGVDTSGSTNDYYDSSGKYYTGKVAATGGTVTTHGSYTVHSFLSGATNFVVGASGNVDILLVGGGGSGGTGGVGSSGHAGGGAGAFRTVTSQALTVNTFTVTVGAGATGTYNASGADGTSGGATSFAGPGISTITADGGGGGKGGHGSITYSGNGSSGGAGYGTGSTTSPGGAYGNAGANGRWSTSAPDKPWAAAAGGGAGAAGSQAVNTSLGGAGGAGSTNDYRTGSNVTYAGGGGGGGGVGQSPAQTNVGGAGGSGGGGAGTSWTSGSVVRVSEDGTANTGGGGGGGGGNNETNPSGSGGSGIVVVRYPTGNLQSIGNMTLISNAQTAQAAPTTGRLMIYEEASTGSTTLDTDLKGYVSRDNGTTYTQTPLTEDIIYETQTFNQGGIDANTALMLHFDGSNGGTTFTDNAPSPHTIMVSGNTNTSTAQKKFGTASGYFDGTGDFLRIATSGDGSYVMGTGNFTVDFWAYDVKVADPDSAVVQIGRGQYGACIGYVHSGGNFVLYLSSSNGGWQIASAVSMGALPGAAWAHYALVRNGNTWTTYKDGTQVSQFSSSASLYVGDEDMQIGRYTYTDNSTTNEMEGYIDELRVSKGVARWTADFTPPTAPYSTGAAAEGYTRRLVSGSVDISGQPSGTNMKYKIETLNQSVSKVCRLHGASLLWA